jgi:hypothetical protein
MKTLAMLLSFVLTLVARVPAQTANEQLFPANPGATWVYRGTVSWYDMPSEKTVTKSVTFKTELLEVLRRQDVGVALFVFRGSPWAYDWTQGNAATEEWLVAESTTHEMYLTDGREEAAKKIRRFADPNDSLRDFFSPDDLLMQLPLKKGAKSCDDESKARTDNMYCWMVASERPAHSKELRGSGLTRASAFQIQFMTLPDDTAFEVVPGIGIVSYEYHHHGSVADTSFALVEFHRAQSSRNPGRICHDAAHQ